MIFPNLYFMKSASIAILSVDIVSAAMSWFGTYSSDTLSCGDKITEATFYKTNLSCFSSGCQRTVDSSGTLSYYHGSICNQSPSAFFDQVLKTSTLPYHVVSTYNSTNCSADSVTMAFFTQAGGDCRGGQSMTANLHQNGSIQLNYYSNWCNSSKTPLSTTDIAASEINRCIKLEKYNMSTMVTVIGGQNCKLAGGYSCANASGVVTTVSSSKKYLSFSFATLFTIVSAVLFLLL